MYGGMSAEERRHQRRTALIGAGLELFGTIGYPSVSVKRICDEAGLTQRYFYESFADREALLGEVYRHCVERLRSTTLDSAAAYLSAAGLPSTGVPTDSVAPLARLVLGAFVDALTQDRRVARIILIEVVGISQELEALRIGAIHDWADLILGFTSGEDAADPRSRLAAIGFVGAFTQLLVDWQMATTHPISADAGPDLFTPAAIHDVATEMLIGAYQRVINTAE